MSEAEKPVVIGRGVVKTFKDFWGRDKVKALRGIDIEIPRGSIFGLLGPNGAGKSTLIKVILGHLYPTSGQISVLGADPRDVETKFKIGYLPERSYLYKNLTAEETLKYFGEILNLSKAQIKSRSEQLLEMVGLQNARKRFVGEFSHGMTRRMGLAQALLNDPEFIILDEPTAGLDPIGCREVKDLIIALGQRGKTVLLTSHLLADVGDVCDDIMTIFGGVVQSQGKIDELLADTRRMKMEFPAVDEATLQEIEALLHSKKIPRSEIHLSSPKQSLENYFLDIVNASSGRQETAGAQKGKGVAAYLRASISEKPKVVAQIEESKLVERKKAVQLQSKVVEEKIIPLEVKKQESVVTVEKKVEALIEVQCEKKSVAEKKVEPVAVIPLEKEVVGEQSVIPLAHVEDEIVQIEDFGDDDEDEELDTDLLDDLSL